MTTTHKAYNLDASALKASLRGSLIQPNDVHPYSAGGACVNFMMEESQERVKASYRDNYERLVAIKGMYDPANFFRVNQNIQPTI